MPPKKIKFNVKKKLPSKTDPKSALPPPPPAKKKKKKKFIVKPEEIPDPEQDDSDEYDNAKAKPKPKKKKFNVKKKAPAKKPVPDKWFLSDDEDYVDGEIVKVKQKSFSTAEAMAEVASGRAFGGDFYFVPDVIQVQDTDKYFG